MNSSGASHFNSVNIQIIIRAVLTIALADASHLRVKIARALGSAPSSHGVKYNTLSPNCKGPAQGRRVNYSEA